MTQKGKTTTVITPLDADVDLNFGIFTCERLHPLVRSPETVLVLATDIQAALSTIPGASSVKRLDSRGVHIVINKAVLQMFKDKANARKGKGRRKK